MERVEIAVIGCGPAGISAAITAKVRNKRILLFGNTCPSNKVTLSHKVQNYPGLADISGEAFAAAFGKHLKVMDISVTKAQVNAVYSMGDYFSVQAADKIYEAWTVILATGIFSGKLLPGEETFLRRGLSYCATCDASLFKEKVIAVVGSNEESDAETRFLSEMVSEIYYFPVGIESLLIPNKKLHIITDSPIAILGDKKAEALKTDKGTYPIDGVFIFRDAIQIQQLVPGIAMDGPHIKVNLNMETNLQGCFACGDVAGKPYQYIKAAGQGNVAALSAVSYLSEKAPLSL